MIYHILNGDSLKEQFPESISGERLVARECLVDGSVEGETLPELFETRERFISELYEDYVEGDYLNESVPEFEKMRSIPDNSEINLWFEDDLFCQVNCWFVIHLLNENNVNGTINLVRPSTDIRFGFGGMSSESLIDAYQQRKETEEPVLHTLRKFWRLYQKGEHQKMLSLAESIGNDYDFVKNAVLAEIDRKPTPESLGRPKQALLDIMKELNTENFGQVFQEFNRRESIYGFGDLQVKRLFDEVRNHR